MQKKVVLQFAVTNGATAVNFLLTVILARLLTPAEVGVFSMSAVLIGFAHVFRDFGVMSFIKRQKTLTPELLRAAAGVLFVTSWSISLIMYFSANVWAVFFGNTGVKDVVQVLALGFIFIPFGALPAAVLNRNLEVEKAAKVSLFTVSIYFVTSVSLAVFGFGYMTMAWANLVNIIFTGIGFNIVRPTGIPFLPSFKGWSQVLNFGAGNVLTSSLKAIDVALPDMLLGKMAGAGHVGLFSRANSTVGIMNSVLGPTISYFALPHMANIHHANGEVGTELGRLTSYLTSVVWPALVLTGIMASDIVQTLYGAAWAGSASAIPWLCAAIAIQVTFSLAPQALLGINKPYVTAFPFSVALAAKIALGILFFDGTLRSFACAVMFAELISVPVYLLILRKYLGISIAAWTRPLIKTVCFTTFFSIFAWCILHTLGQTSNPIINMIIVGIPSLALWISGVLIFKLPLEQEIRSAWKSLKLSP